MNDQPIETSNAPANVIEAFTFGDPEAVLDRRELTHFYEVWHNSRWFEPPIPMSGLAKVLNMSPHHRSAIALKINLLTSHQRPTRWLSANDFERWALDFIQMGNGYLERIPNMNGTVARLDFSPARHTRRGVEEGRFWFVENGIGQEHEFEPGAVFHLQQPDVRQEIYGMPEWISALQSGLLNENATLFRRRYFLNGAHVGSVFYLNEPLADKKTSDAVAEKLRQGKGAGNFKNMFIHIPGGKKDGVQVIPVGETMARDEFASVKNISRDDLLAAHRVPPQLIGIIPQNTGGFGKPGEALDAFIRLEVIPIVRRMRQVNDWLGLEALVFDPYTDSNGAEIALM